MGDEGNQRPATIRFAVFELRPATRELFKQGTRIRLQIKPFQVLEALLDKPGELVTRDELRSRLWPEGTFVDFESGLNTAINRLRSALGDSAEEPRYIETLPRLGYRFICPVQRESTAAKEIAASELSSTPAPQGRPVITDSSPSYAIAEGSFSDESPVEAEGGSVGARPLTPVGQKDRTAALWIISGSVLAAAIVFGAIQLHSKADPSADFRLLNFRGAGLVSARFLSGSRVIYSASQAGSHQTFVANLDGSSNYTVPVQGVVVAASAKGELAVIASDHMKGPSWLRRASLLGDADTPIAEDAIGADWTPDGKQIAVIRQRGEKAIVEFPIGHVIYRSEAWLNCLRVSRDGQHVAFLEHPVHEDDAGHVRVVNRDGSTRVLGTEWSSSEGLAWGPSDRDVWFTASMGGLSRSLYSVSLSGRLRKLSRQPLALRLLDVSSTGRALLAVDDSRMSLRTAVAGKESDISQFDYSDVDDIAHDGSLLLFTESGDAGGRDYAAYVYDLQAHNARRFGSGRALSLSADKSEALTVDPLNWTTLTITCLKTGRESKVPSQGFRYQWARFYRPGELIVGGSYPGQPLLIAYENIRSGQIKPIAGAPYLDMAIVSPDGSEIAGRSSGRTKVFDLRRNQLEPFAQSGLRPIAWSDDGDSLFLLAGSPGPYSIEKYNLRTKQTSPWKTMAPQDAAAFQGLAGIAAAPSSGAYAYSAHLQLSRLYLVDGLL